MLELLTVFLFLPASSLPDCFEELPNVFKYDERRRQTGPLVILIHEAVHFPLPDAVRIDVDFFEHGPKKIENKN